MWRSTSYHYQASVSWVFVAPSRKIWFIFCESRIQVIYCRSDLLVRLIFLWLKDVEDSDFPILEHLSTTNCLTCNEFEDNFWSPVEWSWALSISRGITTTNTPFQPSLCASFSVVFVDPKCHAESWKVNLPHRQSAHQLQFNLSNRRGRCVSSRTPRGLLLQFPQQLSEGL